MIKRIVTVSFLVMIAIVCAVFLRLYFSPVTLDASSGSVSEKLASYGVIADNISLSFDGNIRVSAHRVRLAQNPELFIDKMSVELFGTGILKGQFKPKHIVIDGVDLPDIQRYENKLVFLDYDIPFSGNKEIDINGIIETLYQQQSAFSHLKSIVVRNSSAMLSDFYTGETWQLSGAQISLRKDFLYGLKLSIESRVSSANNPTGFGLKIDMDHHRDVLQTTLSFKDLKPEDFSKYYHHETTLLEGRYSGEIYTIFENNGSIGDITFDIKAKNGALHFTQAYTHPLSFKKLNFNGKYMPENQGTLVISDMHMHNLENHFIQSNATLSGIFSQRPFLDARTRMKGVHDVQDVTYYLPDGKIGNSISWIHNHILKGELSNIDVSFKGYPKDIPNCDEGICGFDGRFDFNNVTLKFLSQVPPIENMIGTLHMHNGGIDISSKSGVLATHNIKNIQAKLRHLFRDTPSMLVLEGTTHGDINELLSILEHKLQPEGPAWNVSIDGTHVSHIDLSLPLKDARIGNLKLDISSDLSDIYTSKLKHPLNAKNATVRLQKTPGGDFNMHTQARALYHDIPVDIVWKEDLHHPLQRTHVNATGVLSHAFLEALSLDKVGILVAGDMPITVDIKKRPQKGYHYHVFGDLTHNMVSFNPLAWQKGSGKLGVSLLGDIQDGNAHVDTLHLKGEDVDILGTLVLDKGPAQIDLSKFILGKNDLKVAYHEGHINIIGKRLDASKIDSNLRKSEKNTFIGDEKLTIHVEELLLKHGTLYDTALTLKFRQHVLDHLDISAKLPQEKKLSFQMAQNGIGLTYIDFNSDDTGYALKTLGLYDNIHQGTTKATIQIDENGFGKGHVHLKDASISDLPILVQLFSIFSLQDLFSSGGVLFNSIQFPINISPTKYTFENVSMKGPSVSLFFSGEYDKPTDALDVKGQFVPVSNINRFIDKIPLVGDLLTGSKKGLLVADFDVGGTLEDPDISTNPLSVFAPGVIQDIWQAISDAGNNVDYE